MLKFRKILNGYFYVKLCFNQSLSYIGIPSDLIQRFLLISVFLKVYGFDNNLVVIPIFIAVIIFITFLGHIAIKFNLNRLETSFHNQYNPELVKILEHTKPKRKR